MREHHTRLYKIPTDSWILIWTFWLITRIIFGIYFSNDDALRYYHNGLIGIEPLLEYPLPNYYFLKFIKIISFNHFFVLYPFAIVALELVLLLCCWRKNARRAAQFLVLTNTILAPLVFARLDLIPGILVGFVAYGIYTHRSRCASILLAIATWFKIWPIVLGTAIVGNWKEKNTYIRLLYFVGALIVITIMIILTGGVDRAFSPLTYQTDRGIQIESLWATPFFISMLLFPHHRWTVYSAPSRSWEIAGQGPLTIAHISDYVFALSILFLFLVAVYHFFTQRWTPHVAIRFMLVAVVTIIATNKVFSPQYLLWFSSIIVVALIFSNDPLLTNIARWYTATAALTIFIFPHAYSLLLREPSDLGMVLMIIRNIMVFVIWVKTIQWWLAAYKSDETHASDSMKNTVQ